MVLIVVVVDGQNTIWRLVKSAQEFSAPGRSSVEKEQEC